MNNFLQFYSQNQISPVSQNLHDLSLHFGRRIGLYRTLGLAASLFQDRDILEVAPGSGHNSIVTATFKPRSYDLVEPNPTGFNKMVSLFEEHKLCTNSIRFFNTRLEDFQEEETYDIVVCEGLIPGLSNQNQFLRHLAARVRKGGILVVTCADAVSVFFESLRRYLARLLVRNLVDDTESRDAQQEAVEILLSAFKSHLSALMGMSRPAEDWIWDNMLNPAAANLAASREFSIEKCLGTLGGEFYFYGCSPVFMSNWNWYKNLPLDPHVYNEEFSSSFVSQRHSFLHYEETGFSNSATNRLLYRYCKVFSSQLEARIPKEWTTISSEIIDLDFEQVRGVQAIADQCGLHRSVAAIAEFLDLFVGGIIPEAKAISEMTVFRSAFGRGQQYLSLIKA